MRNRLVLRVASHGLPTVNVIDDLECLIPHGNEQDRMAVVLVHTFSTVDGVQSGHDSASPCVPIQRQRGIGYHNQWVLILSSDIDS
jgi:hypothetical protein